MPSRSRTPPPALHIARHPGHGENKRFILAHMVRAGRDGRRALREECTMVCVPQICLEVLAQVGTALATLLGIEARYKQRIATGQVQP
jgi:hypothetical protein